MRGGRDSTWSAKFRQGGVGEGTAPNTFLGQAGEIAEISLHGDGTGSSGRGELDVQTGVFARTRSRRGLDPDERQVGRGNW